jgi:hypothetical protein
VPSPKPLIEIAESLSKVSGVSNIQKYKDSLIHDCPYYVGGSWQARGDRFKCLFNTLNDIEDKLPQDTFKRTHRPN